MPKYIVKVAELWTRSIHLNANSVDEAIEIASDDDLIDNPNIECICEPTFVRDEPLHRWCIKDSSGTCVSPIDTQNMKLRAFLEMLSRFNGPECDDIYINSGNVSTSVIEIASQAMELLEEMNA